MKTHTVLLVLLASCGSNLDLPPLLSDPPAPPPMQLDAGPACITLRTDADPPATVTTIVLTPDGAVVVDTHPLDPGEENRAIADKRAAEEANGGTVTPYCDGGGG